MEESPMIFLVDDYKHHAGRPGFKHDCEMATPCQFKQQIHNTIKFLIIFWKNNINSHDYKGPFPLIFYCIKTFGYKYLIIRGL